LVAVKAVVFQYEADGAVKPLLRTFRMMVNHAIWIGRQKSIRGRFRLIRTVYTEFKCYGLHTHYTLNACEVAAAILKNSKRAHRAPVAKKLFLKLDNQTYRLQDDKIRLPMRPKEFLTLKLKAGRYQHSFLEDPNLRRGSITLTEQKVVIAFEKRQWTPLKYGSVLAFDTNELSLDGIISNEVQMKTIHVDLRKLAEIRAIHFNRCRFLQRRLAHCQRKLFARLAEGRGRERKRIDAILHNVTKQQVNLARLNQAKILLEDLKGVRRSVNRRKNRLNPYNGRICAMPVYSKVLKRRLNNWPFRRLHKFNKYKAMWAGVLLDYVPAWNTSRTCARCGCLQTGLRGAQDPKTRMVFRCPKCGWTCNRHLNAALNLLKTQDEGRWFSPDRLPNEVMTAKRAYEEEAKPSTEEDLTGPI
jgi:IS605 OrfB family transposase